MVPTYIRFLFAYANSDQNGDGCQGVGCCCGCCGLYAGVQFQATIPTSCWPTIRKSARGRFDWLRAGDENIYKSLGAWLPIGGRRHVGDADESPKCGGWVQVRSNVT